MVTLALFRFVLYAFHRDEWIVVKPEQVLSLQMKTRKTKLKYSKTFVVYLVEDQVRKYEFRDALFDEDKVMKLEGLINEKKLSFYY